MKSQPKNILVFNVGSSSVKAALFHGKHELFHLNIDRVVNSKKRAEAVNRVARVIELSGFKISAIAHRIVHGGPIKEHQIITKKLFSQLKKISTLAPLHNIPELEVVTFCQRKFGTKIKQIAVFDTGFHANMPDFATAYGLPLSYFKKGLRRYGFHGISHQYVTNGLHGKVISCHLGNGCSITAVLNGKSIDTSMGFTPLEGLVMGTRCGTVDVGLILYLMDELKMSVKDMKHMLNRESGLFGLSGISSDMRDLLKVERTNKKAKFAMDVFCYHVAKTIGSYATSLNGVDTIVFTGGIGQNSPRIRELICKQLEYLGVVLDSKKNSKNERVVSEFMSPKSKSKVCVLAVPTNEELAMVQVASKIIS